ncbi:MAG: hypothetical protein LC746_03555 [Acidobacteria bacterium]|nr:hypothetical protein [Acidobacteriota bacterium]
MKRSWRTLLLVVCGLALFAAGWLWWNRPQQVEMDAYVPQDSLIYLEADSLPEVLSAIGSTDAWRTLAPAAGVRQDFTRVGWLTSFARWTGIGSAESVVFARAQVAVAVLGVDAKEEQQSLALNVSPRLVVVVETHTGGSRARQAIERVVGDFTRRAYGSPKFEQSDHAGTHYAVWTAPSGGKKITAAVSGSAAFIGNDEAAVQTCLSAWRGERASLASDPELAGMRRRVGGDDADALVFGYVPQASAPKVTQIAALVVAGSSQADAREQSALATVLPQLAGRVLGGAAWSTKVVHGSFEDDYYFALPSQLVARLSVALEASPERAFKTADFIPSDAHQVTRYSFAEPIETWRGVNAVVSSQLDPTFAPFASAFLDKSLKPFGIESPRDFLPALGSEIATARLGEEGDDLILVAAARDEAKLRELIKKRLGAKVKVERVGDAEMLVSPDPELGAASVFGGHVILGSEDGVRRCLEAHFSGRTLADSDAFKKPLASALQDDAPPVTTLTDEREKALRFVTLLAPRASRGANAPDASSLARAVASLPYSLTVTRLKADGFERTTISPSGLIGDVALQFAPEAQSGK